MGRGEAFSSHETIYSQSISEPVPLDCELYKCFSAFSPYLSGTRLLEAAEVGYFLFPGQWGFDNTPASRVLISFSWGQAAFKKKKKNNTVVHFRMFPFLHRLPDPEGIFLWYLLREFGGVSGSKSHSLEEGRVRAELCGKNPVPQCTHLHHRVIPTEDGFTVHRALSEPWFSVILKWNILRSSKRGWVIYSRSHSK